MVNVQVAVLTLHPHLRSAVEFGLPNTSRCVILKHFRNLQHDLLCLDFGNPSGGGRYHLLCRLNISYLAAKAYYGSLSGHYKITEHSKPELSQHQLTWDSAAT